MGNNHSEVLPMLEEDVPWVMLTYNPEPKYNHFTFYAQQEVFSNNGDRMNDCLIGPEPAYVSVQYNIENKDSIGKAVKDVRIGSTMVVKELVHDLLNHHQLHVKNEALRNADKVRILFYWITAQNIKYSEYNLTVDFETVNYQLQKLRDKKNSYAAFFSLLCYYADIPCVIVRGHVKGGWYEVGKPLTDNLIREWNAVFVDDRWQFVDAFWGQIYQGQFVNRDEWYLFPNPNHLQFSHLPENAMWQLVERPISQEEFVKQPILKKRFFQMDMELLSLSHPTGELRCSEGEIELDFLLNSKDIDSQEYRCVTTRQNETSREWEVEILPEEHLQLDFVQKTSTSVEEEGSIELLDDDEINESGHQLAEHENMQSSEVNDGTTVIGLSVRVKFPRTGYYKLEIFGRQSEDEDYDWVAIYHVKVTWVPNWLIYFPRMKNIGWGPNAYLKKCGLRALSHTNGEIKCFAPNQLEIKFKILPDAKTSNVKLFYKLKKTSETATVNETDGVEQNEREMYKPTQDETILIPIYIESIGDYEISIAAFLNETYDKGDVIHYRVISEEDQSAIREELANEALRELEKAMVSQDFTDLRKAIRFATVKKVQAHPRVKPTLKEVSDLFVNLQNYRNAIKRIGKIDNRHIANIRTYMKPDHTIVIVMRAVFIILGEPENKLQNWDDIKHFVTNIGPKGVNRRINNVDMKQLSGVVVNNAQKTLKDIDTVGALKIAEAVAAFANWLEMVFKTHKIMTLQVARAGCSNEGN